MKGLLHEISKNFLQPNAFMKMKKIRLYHPNNYFIKIWELFMVLLISATFFYFSIKYLSIYNQKQSEKEYIDKNIVVSILIPCIFANVIITLNSSYLGKDGNLVNKRSLIIYNYFSYYFFF